MKVIKFFGIKINPIRKSDFLNYIESQLKEGNKIVQNGVNAASLLELVHDEDVVRAYRNSDLVNIDGMSVVWALRFFGYYVPERVACPDLAEDIMKMAEKDGYSVFFFGAQQESVTICVRKIMESYPGLKISGFRNGFFNADDEHLIIEMINSVNTDILFLGLPSPKKELFVEKNKNLLNVKYMLGVGGYFDIISGITKRAPHWMQRIGMEWFYRFLQEPVRMWRRYLIGNFKFIWLVVKERITRKKNKPRKRRPDGA
jgi:N-acetylglucosaminyldiphosphoundecaprenol N-acetyl-beta-D-mannosaminyltransferase